ncbi:MAG: DUF1330 domain-containing protein [Paracoccaceae bacterium]
MKGYWLILGTAITDPAAQEEYGRLWAPIAARYGARLVRDAASLDLKEGRDTARVLLVEFPDLAAARDCYADPAYAAAREQALKASQRNLLIFEGDVR